jgi:uncharacterized protein
MKILIFLTFIITAISSCNQATKPQREVEEVSTEVTFDSVLAQKLGADDYGMRPYVMAFLKSGPNRSQDSAEAAQLQRAHLDNIGRLAEEGILSLAGPFLDGGELRGIYIFNVTTIEEAKALTETDPAIQQGRLVMELHPWYGSAALMQVNEIHKKIAKINI